MDLSILLLISGPPGPANTRLENLESTLPRRWCYEVIRADTGSNRAARFNAAARAARAPVLCLLDPGTTLMHGWLAPMWMLLHSDPRAGCIGNIQREPYSGLIEHAGLVFDADGLPVPAGRNEAVPPSWLDTRQPAVSMACALVRRDVFLRLDGFDERFRSDRFSDADFCLRAAEKGFRHFVANRSVVYHHATDPTPGDDDLAIYRARWGNRASIYHREKMVRLARNDFSPERWETGREARRQWRQELARQRRVGRGYLRKHLLSPWRYNFGRICRALVQAAHPLPPAVPALPEPGSNRVGDVWLFNPPRR